MSGDPEGLRDEIVRVLRAEIPDDADCAAVEPTGDEAGVYRLMVIDPDANCYRVSVQSI